MRRLLWTSTALAGLLGWAPVLQAKEGSRDIQVRQNDQEIVVDTNALQARIRKTGYVSGIAAGSFLDKKTGAHDLGFGLHIMDFLLAPGWQDDGYPRDPQVHGNLPKHYIEGPQICTQARHVDSEVVRGKGFVAVRLRYRFTQAAPGLKAGSLWEQTLVFQPGLRYVLTSERITSVNEVEDLFYRIDMPGHVRHHGGDTFTQVYLSYLDRPIPAAEFTADFPPDSKFFYRRQEGKIPERMIRAYQIRVNNQPGPWLAGMTLDAAEVAEAWCHQRGYICLIEELHRRPVKAGESFGAAYVVGFFDSIPEMNQVYDRYKGARWIALENGKWKLIGAATARERFNPAPSRSRLESRSGTNSLTSRVLGQSQVAEDFRTAGHPVQAVEVEAGHSMVQEFPANLGTNLHTQPADGFLILAIRFQAPAQVLGEFGAAQAGEAFDLFRAQKGQHARNDGHPDATFVAKVVLKIEEVAGVIEQLSDDELRPGFHLGRGPVPIQVLVGALLMPFRIAGRPNGEAAPFPDEAHQFRGVGKPARDRFELRLAPRRIASQGQDILNAQPLRFVEDGGQHVARAADTGQVGHGLDAEFLAQALDHAQGAVPGAATGAISNGHEGRLQILQGGDGFPEQSLLGLIRFRRKQLQGNRRLCLSVQFRNTHAYLPLRLTVIPAGFSVVGPGRAETGTLDQGLP